MLKKVLLGVGALLLLAGSGGAVFVSTFEPDQRPASDVKIDATAEMVKRGEYLVNHVVGCAECHSERDWSQYGGPISGVRMAGGFCWPPEMKMPGKVCMPNITPDDNVGIGKWTDGEIMRSIREGVDRNGHVIFPQMPYGGYRHLSDDDTQAIVAYLRTVKASDQKDEASALDFPVSFFVKMAPKPLDGPVSAPERGETKEYGEYLATVSGCIYCHTPADDQHQMIEEKHLSGGHEFPGPWGLVNTANLTPHETGLTMTREGFIDLFKSFADQTKLPKVDAKDNTVMPWLVYAGMTKQDLGAIYDYLKSVPPIENEVERRPRSGGSGTEKVAKEKKE